MKKRNLSRGYILSKAYNMVDKIGHENFSIRKLARELGVQPSSLYNHIENEDDLLLEVASKAATWYKEFIGNLVVGLSLDDATLKAADGFLDFVQNHQYLYMLLLEQRWSKDPRHMKIMDEFLQPIFDITNAYGITDKANQDILYVTMRVITHGFSTLVLSGAVDDTSNDTINTYHLLVMETINKMKKMAQKENLKNE